MTERVLAVIPALNAGRSVGPIARDSAEYAAGVLVVDDGSSDETSRVAAEAGAVVLRHETNRGKGAALKTGFAYALEHGFDGVVTIDADGQHLPHNIPELLSGRAEHRADLVIGARAHLFHQMLPRRRIANRLSAWSISKAAGKRIIDSQSGFRYYSSELIRSVPLRADGFDLESEVIVRAGRRGMTIISIPIELGFVDGLSTSHYRPVKDTLKIVWTVFRTLVTSA